MKLTDCYLEEDLFLKILLIMNEQRKIIGNGMIIKKY